MFDIGKTARKDGQKSLFGNLFGKKKNKEKEVAKGKEQTTAPAESGPRAAKRRGQ
jgi:hypothetical protein